MLQNPELHYLDNAATTIVAPEVADVINKAMRELSNYRYDPKKYEERVRERGSERLYREIELPAHLLDPVQGDRRLEQQQRAHQERQADARCGD